MGLKKHMEAPEAEREYVIFGNTQRVRVKASGTCRLVREVLASKSNANEIKYFPGVQQHHCFIDTCMTLPYTLIPRVSPSYTLLSKFKDTTSVFITRKSKKAVSCLCNCSNVHVFCYIL